MLPKTGGCTAGTGVEVAEGAKTGGGVTWGEIPWVLPPFPSTPSLSGCVVSQGLGTGGSLVRLECCCLRGSGIKEKSMLPQD